MTKKRLWSFIGVGGVILLVVLVYSFSFSKPRPFPSNTQSLEELNSVFPKVGAEVVLNTIFLDEHHVYVPFIFDGNANGMSLWEWKSRKWKVVYIATNGQPIVWKTAKNDPSAYQIVWNFSEQSNLDFMKLYLTKRRNYYVSDNVEHYFPGVQMEEGIKISENPYGSMQMPNDWISVMQSAKLSPNKSSLFTSFINDPEYFSFRWLPYDKSGKLIDPLELSDGYSSWNDVIDLENVLWMDESGLE